MKFKAASLKLLTTLFAVLFISGLAHAKLFHNAYVQFELPDQWNCNIDGTEWICSSDSKIDSKESIIVLTAKEVGPQDSLPIYENYLMTPKPVQLANGKTVLSQVKNVQNRKINDQPWVDSLHLGSEIPGYYTRYLTTIKDNIAILVTLSAHQKYYTKYSNDFFKAVETLKVIASNNRFNQRVLAPVKPKSERLGVGVSAIELNDNDVPLPHTNSIRNIDAATFGGVFLLLVAMIFYILKRRKNKNKKI